MRFSCHLCLRHSTNLPSKLLLIRIKTKPKLNFFAKQRKANWAFISEDSRTKTRWFVLREMNHHLGGGK